MPNPNLRSLLFYIDCEVLSTLGRPITDLAWTAWLTRDAEVEVSLVPDEVRWVNRWVRHHRSVGQLVASDPDLHGSAWLSGMEVKLVRHAVREFCALSASAQAVVQSVQEKIQAAAVSATETPDELGADISGFLERSIAAWHAKPKLLVAEDQRPTDQRSEEEHRALDAAIYRSISPVG